MATSLETRAPLWTIDWWSSAPPCRPATSCAGPDVQVLLRRLMQDRLPPAILTRPKMGFGVPVGEWLRGELRPLLEDTVLSSRALGRSCLAPDAVRTLVDEHVSRRVDRPAHVWALLMPGCGFARSIPQMPLCGRLCLGLAAQPPEPLSG